MTQTPSFRVDGSVDRLAERGYGFATLSEEAKASVRTAFVAGSRFFNATLMHKMSTRLPLDAGFRPYGVEMSRPGSRPDEVESFTVSGRSNTNDTALLSGHGAELHAAMTIVFDGFVPTIAKLVSDLSAHFGVRPPISAETSMRHWSILQMNYSCPSKTTVEFINEEHEDGCLLTAMLTTAPGLEISVGKYVFEAVEPKNDRLVLASGEILWLLTGGNVRPTYHRVRRIDNVAERISLLFFADFGPDLCAPWIESDVNRDVSIGERVLTNATRFGLAEWASE